MVNQRGEIKMNNNELYHHGILGMKWGVRRSRYKTKRNYSLEKKALKYDKKAAVLTKKSEKIHADKDLEDSNKNAIKAAKYLKKAAKLKTKSLKTSSEFNKGRFNKKASTLEYKAAKKQIEANRLSKTARYGFEAMKYSVKSDEARKSAAKMRMKIAYNNYYIEKMNRKINSSDLETRKIIEEYINKLNK